MADEDNKCMQFILNDCENELHIVKNNDRLSLHGFMKSSGLFRTFVKQYLRVVYLHVVLCTQFFITISSITVVS